MRTEALDVFDSDDRLPGGGRGEYLYNYWRTRAIHAGCGDAPPWTSTAGTTRTGTSSSTSTPWPTQRTRTGCGAAQTSSPRYTRALVGFTRGGGDAYVVREFDMATRKFVVDGFNLPEAKHDVSWEDDDTLLVGTDFGEGSLTESGYPRVIKRWRRGTLLGDAETVFSGSVTDVSVSATVFPQPGFERTFFYRSTDFYNKESFELRSGELVRIDVPTDCSMGTHRQWAMILLTSDWERGDTTYKAGSVLVTEYEHILAGAAELHVVFEPGGGDFFAAGVFTGDVFLSIKLRDVATVVEVITPGTWEATPLAGVPENTNTGLASVDAFGDEIILSASAFDKPTRLLLGPSAGPVKEIKSAPKRFDADGLVVAQRFATSDDGTRGAVFPGDAGRFDRAPARRSWTDTVRFGRRSCPATSACSENSGSARVAPT